MVVYVKVNVVRKPHVRVRISGGLLNLALMKEQREKNKKYVNNIKKRSKCSICGESEVCCLEFHHLDPSTKVDSIMNMLNESRGTLIKEIKKCIVLCSNCHKKVHAGVIKL